MDIMPTYTETGAGSPLVLLHGNGEDSTYFFNQMAAFAVGRRVIAVDTRGHGQTPRGDAPFTLSQFADDLRVLLDKLELPRVDLLGYSDGGNIALLFALRYPARVRRLILNGANLTPSGLKCHTRLGISLAYACFTVAAPLFPQARPLGERYALMAVQPYIPSRSLAALPMPVLVIAGTRDLIRERHTRHIAASLPDGRLALVPGGHAVARENPGPFNRAVLEFLSAEKP